MKKRKAVRIVIITAFIIVAGAALFLLYAGNYYHALDDVGNYYTIKGRVTITETECGLLLDGEGDENALIFYPGAKVEYTAYIPLLYEIAEKGVDVFLVKMPFNLAFFGINRADEIISSFNYSHFYICGHSLGGAMAAYYASGKADKLDGIIFLASFTTKDLKDTGLRVLTLYGSEDGVLSFDKVAEGRKMLPSDSEEVVIEGANHAFFGLYGEQKGDGKATISAEKQRSLTAKAISSFILRGSALHQGIRYL